MEKTHYFERVILFLFEIIETNNESYLCYRNSSYTFFNKLCNLVKVSFFSTFWNFFSFCLL